MITITDPELDVVALPVVRPVAVAVVPDSGDLLADLVDLITPVQPVMPDARAEVQPHGAAVALQRPRPDLPGCDVVQPVIQPLADHGCVAGRVHHAGVPLGFDGANLGDHVGALGAGHVAPVPPAVLLPHGDEAVPPALLVPVDRGLAAGALAVLGRHSTPPGRAVSLPGVRH
jgi:hypothetical protein